MIVSSCAIVFWKWPSLSLVLMCRVPRARDNLSASSHRLRVGIHDTNGAHIVENIFCCDSFVSGAALSKFQLVGFGF